MQNRTFNEIEPPVRVEHQCGLALGGPDAGVCKDSKCNRRSPTLIAGYCVTCAPKHGLNPLMIVPAGKEPQTCDVPSGR